MRLDLHLGYRYVKAISSLFPLTQPPRLCIFAMVWTPNRQNGETNFLLLYGTKSLDTRKTTFWKKKLNGLIFKSRNAHEENQWKITSLTSSICFLRSIKFDVSLLLQLQVQSVWAQNFVFFRGAFASKRHVLPWHKMQSCHVAAEQRTDTYFSECSSGPSKPEVVGMPVRK